MLRSLGAIRVAGIVFGGAVALWVSVGVTLNLTIARQVPQFTQLLWPEGVMAEVAKARDLLTTARKLPVAKVDGERAALRDAALREPVNTQALGMLATLDEYRGKHTRARALFQLSEAVSRRNTLVQFWLIEDAVARGNIVEAVQHYDRAMRVSADARTTLLPVLVAASGDLAIRQAVATALAPRPAWWKDYLNRLAVSGEHGNAMMAALESTRPDIRKPDERFLVENILRKMVMLRDEHRAILAVNRLEGHAGQTRPLQDGNFEIADSIIPFGWWLRDDGSIRAYRDTVPNGSLGLRIITNAGASGTVAQQFFGLQPGHYALTASAGGIPTDILARPSIQIACSSGKQLARVVLPPSGEQGSRFHFEFDVPATACGVQSILVSTAPAEDTNIWLDNIVISR